MADKKITALTSLTSTQKAASVDLLHIIDFSSSPVNKKITVADLFARADTDISSIGATTLDIGPATTKSALKVNSPSTNPAATMSGTVNTSGLASGVYEVTVTNSGAFTVVAGGTTYTITATSHGFATGALVNISVTGTTATITRESEVVVNENGDQFVDFRVESSLNDKAIHVDASVDSGAGNSNTVTINGGAIANTKKVDFKVNSSVGVLAHYDSTDHAIGIGTATPSGNFMMDVVADATTGGSINMAGWMSFSGSDVVDSATAGQTASADTPVTRVTLSTGTSNTLNLPTTDVYQGQIKYIVCNVESGGGTLALQTTNRVPATAMTFQDIGDSVTLMWDATASKWIVLGVIGMTTNLA